MAGHYCVALELPQASPDDMARLNVRLGTAGSASFAGIGFVTFRPLGASSELDAIEYAFNKYVAACRDLKLAPCPLEMMVE